MQRYVSEKEFTSLTEEQRVMLANCIHKDVADVTDILDKPT